MDPCESEARERRDKWLEEQRARGDVPATSDPLWDVYMAALCGLDAVFTNRAGAVGRLAYIVRRIEQHNLACAKEEPKAPNEPFKELHQVIADA